MEPRRLLAGDVVISEFMASNQNTLADEDGAYSDWIEIHNPSPATVQLAGWRLTDKAADPSEWTFPAVALDPGGYLVVFASGKDRIDPARTLHTNFKFDANGEYLALVRPDGTIASAFSPEFPRQKDDVSYGPGQQISSLVTAGATAAVLVPGNGDLGSSWATESFSDLSWTRGATGVGFEVGAAQLPVAAYGNNAGSVGSQEYGGSLGMDFRVVRSITVTQLGVFDSGANGLSRTLAAQIWTRSGNSGTLVTQLTFTPESPGALVGGDRFKALAAPLVLQPGEYTMVAYGYGPGEPNGNVNGPTLAEKTTNSGSGAIEFVGSGRYGTAGAFPVSVDGGPANRYSAGTFKFLVPAFPGLIRTSVQSAMYGTNASAYLRIPVTCVDPATYSSLSLQVKYDDGFVAYLNGTEVARRNAPDTLAWNSAATAARPVEQAVVYESINITDHVSLLHPGVNVLAIQALNVAASDPDFLVLPQLIAADRPDGAPRYFDSPTPGTPNNSASSFAGFVEETQASVGHGFFDAPVDVAITSSTSGAQIYFTLDGSEPSQTHGTLYQNPIHITATTMLRAAGFKSGFLPTQINTQTYLFPSDVARQPKMSALITNDPVWKTQVTGALLALPTISVVTGSVETATGYPPGYEVPTSVELINPDGSPGFQVNAGIERFGGASDYEVPKKSLRVSFKGVYGPTKLDYDLFGGGAATQFDQILLRGEAYDTAFFSSGTLGSYVRSHLVTGLQLAMGQPSMHERFVHLYVNGVYMGQYSLMERPTAPFMASYFGGSKEDYDAIHFEPKALDGDLAAWNAMAAATGNYALLQQYMDVTNYADYMLLEFYTGNVTDWGPNANWMAARKREAGAGFKFFSWDQDFDLRGMGPPGRSTVIDGHDANTVGYGGPGNMWGAISQNPEFKILLADRAQKWFFGGGVLTTARVQACLESLASQITKSIIAECARWGDNPITLNYPPLPDYTPTQWRQTIDYMKNHIIPTRENVVVQQLRSAGLFPAINAPAFNQQGGAIPAGFSLTMSGSGTVYYTLDGSDPRLAGGGIHGTRYTGPVVLQESKVVKARVFSGSTWSAMNEAVFLVDGLPRAGSLVVTEVNYHPALPTQAEQTAGFTDPEVFEFIELTNTSATQTLDLDGVRFSNGVAFDFSTATIASLGPGQRLVVVRDPAAFTLRYGPGLPVAGTYTGSLDNGGERIVLEDAGTGVIADFDYRDDGAWPGRADGQGSSLELVSTAAAYNDATNWQSSADYNGSPGRAGTQADVVINEVLAHTVAPAMDVIELYNTSASPVDVGGWYLSDASDDYLKFCIPDNTVIAGRGYLVFRQGHWTNGTLEYAADEFGGGAKGFGLNGAHGDDLYLVQADVNGRLLRFADHVDFPAMGDGESFGRWQDAEGRWHFVPMQEPTLDAPSNANSAGGNGPRVGPLILSELMYAPKALTVDETAAGFMTPEDMEFIEVFNPTASAVTLTDWRLDKAVTYAFAAGTSLGARSTLVVAPFDPANSTMLGAFRTRYGIGSGVKVVGPYSGHLSNTSDKVQLQRPDVPPPDDPTWLPLLTEDEVAYRSVWGASADGKSLERVAADAWGDSKANWGAATASPGTAQLVAGAYVFYNDSAFDGRAAAANSDDDRAIATDKRPLLPGRRATLDNYTSFSRGINGIIVDLPGASGTVVAGDFGFRVSTGNPPTWTTLASAATVTSRTAYGMNRITLIWPDNVVQNQWLEVTLRAGTGIHTGLAAPHVFYFGNAIGETGNHGTGPDADAVVDPSDELDAQARATSVSPAPMTSRYDFNRDRRINATDILIARANYRQGMDALPLLDLTGGGQMAEAMVVTRAAASVAGAAAGGAEDIVPSTEYPGPSPQSRECWKGNKSITQILDGLFSLLGTRQKERKPIYYGGGVNPHLFFHTSK